MKLIIAGSRKLDLDDAKKKLNKFLFTFTEKYSIIEVVSGTATGADTIGEQWALSNNVKVNRMPAEWNKYGRAAGPIRNEEMGDYADAAVVLWDGESRGSKHMIKYMYKLEKPCHIILVEKNVGEGLLAFTKADK